jgi:hypothetical protein
MGDEIVSMGTEPVGGESLIDGTKLVDAELFTARTLSIDEASLSTDVT